MPRSTDTELQGIIVPGMTYASGDKRQFLVQVTITDSLVGLQPTGGIGNCNYDPRRVRECPRRF